jgi:hypothetical protein
VRSAPCAREHPVVSRPVEHLTVATGEIRQLGDGTTPTPSARPEVRSVAGAQARRAAPCLVFGRRSMTHTAVQGGKARAGTGIALQSRTTTVAQAVEPLAR